VPKLKFTITMSLNETTGLVSSSAVAHFTFARKDGTPA
jgi:hypothetical protein